MRETSFNRLLGIDLPIVQAPIGSATTPELAAAVSNAGGLGMLSITWRSLEETREVIRSTRRLTARPFGINLVLEWDPAARLQIALEEHVPVISFFWGDAAPWIPVCHESGALVFVTVGAPDEAKAAVLAGADVIVAQGWEAGGHVWGEMSTLALVPAAVDAVPDTPVLAAGGIADGRGIAAALALGASGVWIGTRFLLADETPIHSEYAKWLLAAQGVDTVHTTVFERGWPRAAVRALRNSTWKLGEPFGELDQRPGQGDQLSINLNGDPVFRYSSDFPMAGMEGDLEAMCLYAGQGIGLIGKRQPAGEIVRELMTQTEAALKRLD